MHSHQTETLIRKRVHDTFIDVEEDHPHDVDVDDDWFHQDQDQDHYEEPRDPPGMKKPCVETSAQSYIAEVAESFQNDTPLNFADVTPSPPPLKKSENLVRRVSMEGAPRRSSTCSSSTSSASSEKGAILLDKDFQPGNWHVIYGREKSHKEHVGNRRLRVLIANNLKAYVEAPSRREKSHIIDDVVSQILCYGGFLKKTDDGRWLSIGPVQSREKVGHAFRDCMKHFRGQNKPCEKKRLWVEAQDAIFKNMQLLCPSASSSSSLSSTTTSFGEETEEHRIAMVVEPAHQKQEEVLLQQHCEQEQMIAPEVVPSIEEFYEYHSVTDVEGAADPLHLLQW